MQRRTLAALVLTGITAVAPGIRSQPIPIIPDDYAVAPQPRGFPAPIEEAEATATEQPVERNDRLELRIGASLYDRNTKHPKSTETRARGYNFGGEFSYRVNNEVSLGASASVNLVSRRATNPEGNREELAYQSVSGGPRVTLHSDELEVTLAAEVNGIDSPRFETTGERRISWGLAGSASYDLGEGLSLIASASGRFVHNANEESASVGVRKATSRHFAYSPRVLYVNDEAHGNGLMALALDIEHEASNGTRAYGTAYLGNRHGATAGIEIQIRREKDVALRLEGEAIRDVDETNVTRLGARAYLVFGLQ